MQNLGAPKIDLTKFLTETPVHEVDGQKVDAESLINSVSMISMKLDSNNVEYVKNLTTEGLSKHQRLSYIKKIRKNLDADLFELSTCNRVLYVGFGTDCIELESTVLSTSSFDEAPFNHYSGIDV